MAKRSTDQIKDTNFVYLHSEAMDIAGLSYVTLWRHVQQGRLKAFGSPLKCDYDHLVEQTRNDFPKLKKTQAA